MNYGSMKGVNTRDVLPAGGSSRRGNKYFRCREDCQYHFARAVVTSAVNMNIPEKCITIDNLNPNIKIMEYAVRGPLVIRASEIEKELEKGVKKPFKEVIKANIGDCHAMGQQPITFIRQVVALVSYPELINDPRFAADAKSRAKDILNGCRARSVGAYTDSSGIEIIRRHIAAYIQERDGIPCNYEDIILSAGASGSIKNILKLFISNESTGNKKPGVMVPIPQYPLYSATLAEFNMHQIGYYLDEENGWGLDMKELKRAVDEARKDCRPRAIVVINPGNPTGQVLSKKNIEEIIRFAYQERLFILADEVYQLNVYAEGCAFHSFKKVMNTMGFNSMELASFMSVSKGYMGECGFRGGCTEVVNIDPDVKAMLLKCISANLCPNVLGQAVMDVVVSPPKPGEPSYELFEKEKRGILDSLAQRAKMVEQAFNSIEGMSCNVVQGAMYAFPQIKLPKKAIEKAQQKNLHPDAFYAFELLENTGICIVPGSGFGQKEGTYHFRTTILPQPEKLKMMLEMFRNFHEKFLKKYH